MKTAFKLTAYTIILFFAVAMVASSCKKEELKPTRIKTVTHTDTQGNNPLVELYEYDDNDRLSKVYINDTLAVTYQYQDLTVVEKAAGGNTVYTLNTDGYVTSVNVSFSTIMDFYYGSVGYVSRTVQGPAEKNYVWNADNLTQVYGADTVDYTYLSDKYTTIGNEYRGQAFLGKDSKNLINTVTYSTTPSTPVTYSYEFDGDRVSKRTVGNTVEIYTYY